MSLPSPVLASGPAACRRALLMTAFLLAGAGLNLAPIAALADIDDFGALIEGLRRDWAMAAYRTPASQQQAAFESLVERGRAAAERFPQRAEPHIMHGVALSFLAGIKGGLPAWQLIKRARTEFERAIAIDPRALNGAALYQLGELYYRVPGWPVGFGDPERAEALMKQAIAVDPTGVAPRLYYAGFLIDRKRTDEARRQLELALQAPPRPGDPIADAGRRADARALLGSL
jgi:tetratricopeptide (TPR) repeat protein